MALLDAVGQVLGNLRLEAAQQDGPQARAEAAAGDGAVGEGLLAVAGRLVNFVKFLGAAKVAGLDEVHDAPQIEQAVFQWRAGEGHSVFAIELLD